MNKIDKDAEFKKYKTKGPYHWEQISSHLLKRNSFVLGRYKNMIYLAKEASTTLVNKKILDVGCGDGVLSYFFAKKGAIVSGIDNSNMAIEFAKTKTNSLNIDFRQESAYDLPYKNSSFDIVVSSDVIEHIGDISKYLSEIYRVVKNGGIVVISTPIRFTEYPLDKEHIVEWFPDEFKKVIGAKFKNTKYYYSHPLALEQIYQAQFFGKQWAKVIVNLFSFIKNPFDGFNSRFKYLMLQYSVSKVEK